MRTFLLFAIIAGLMLTGCSSSAPEPKPEADLSVGLPPSTSDRPELPFALQGPVVAGAIPSAFAPPVGQCRVWLPGAPLVDQPDPALCSRVRSHVPLGGLLIHTPADGVIQITKYDEFVPDLVVHVAHYDAATGDPIRDLEDQ